MHDNAELHFSELLAAPLVTGIIAALILLTILNDSSKAPLLHNQREERYIEVVGAVEQPGRHIWPEDLPLESFVKERILLAYHADGAAATLSRSKGSIPQLRIPSQIYFYIFISGAVNAEGWYPVTIGTTWKDLHSIIPLSPQADLKALMRKRRTLRAWEKLVIK